MMTRKSEHDQVTGLSMEKETMSDEMPTNIFLLLNEGEEGTHLWCEDIPNDEMDVVEYTLVHNNPDYHVIKKSDVKKDIICWWSGGITSAVACYLAILTFGVERCRVIMLDTGNEHFDTYRFMGDCEQWYGLKIEVLRSKHYDCIQDVWYKYNSLNVASGAVCSSELKKRVRLEWEKENDFSHQVFGFEFDAKEFKRAMSMKNAHSQTNPLFPLLQYGMTKKDCIKYVEDAGVEIPMAYTMGFQNNNCLNTGCVQGGIGYWKKMQIERPDVFDKMAQVEHDLTNRKGEPVTMLKDQSKVAKESGITLVFLKAHPDYPQYKTIDDMEGRPVEPLTECNGFCGSNDLTPSPTMNEINFQGDLL